VISIRGIYTGKEIKPLEDIRVRPNVGVIITFLDDVEEDMYAKKGSSSSMNSTEIFLEKCGGWEDTRGPEEIIADIYDSRTSSDRGPKLFQENLE
jgi:hypothetical protein